MSGQRADFFWICYPCEIPALFIRSQQGSRRPLGVKLPRPALARLLVHGFVYSSDSRGDAGRSEFSASPLPGAQRGGEEARAWRAPRVPPPRAGGAGPRLRARLHARLQGALQHLSAGPREPLPRVRSPVPAQRRSQLPFFFYARTGRQASSWNC